ncbi:hypothetical protein ACFLXY_05990 [Chloroflexota bacterium]
MENISTQNNADIQKNTALKRTIHDKAIYSFMKSLGYSLTGRLHFKQERFGEIIKTADGHDCTIFRQVIVDKKSSNREYHGITLRIIFSFAHGSSKQNIILSLIPIPFITGLPGFRSKIWAIRKDNGDFLGVYEWDKLKDTEKYKHSFAIKLMTKRAVPGSVKFQLTLPT